MYNIITDRYKKFVMRKFFLPEASVCVCFMGKAESGTGERELTTGGHHDEGCRQPWTRNKC